MEEKEKQMFILLISPLNKTFLDGIKYEIPYKHKLLIYIVFVL